MKFHKVAFRLIIFSSQFYSFNMRSCVQRIKFLHYKSSNDHLHQARVHTSVYIVGSLSATSTTNELKAKQYTKTHPTMECFDDMQEPAAASRKKTPNSILFHSLCSIGLRLPHVDSKLCYQDLVLHQKFLSHFCRSGGKYIYLIFTSRFLFNRAHRSGSTAAAAGCKPFSRLDNQ